MASTLPRLPVFQAIASHDPQSTVVVHSLSGRKFTYGQLLRDVARAKDQLRQAAQGQILDGERIAFLVENSYDYVVTLLSVLASNAIAVPMSPAFPAHELQYIVNQSAALMLLASDKCQEKAQEVLKEGLEHEPISAKVAKRLEGASGDGDVELVAAPDEKGGMMLYTSGTTNRPKGVLIPISTLTAQSQSLNKAWEYSPQDRLLHLLPLHHIHGTVNAILTPLFAGSSIEFMFPFNANHVWERLAAPFLPTRNGETTTTTTPPQQQRAKITFLTVVPTIYNRLLHTHKSLSPELQEAARTATRPEHLRLNISGSAALPTPTKAAWAELSAGNVLLERYGMTEVGMALSCGLDFADRVDGSVGWPLPFVEARLVDTDTNEVIADGEEVDQYGRERQGEVQLRGPTIFREYWRNPEATAKEFVEGEDGKGKWFKTGDVAVRREVSAAGKSNKPSQDWCKGKMYFIQGRKSADIIKTGGEKVSALEVEREMLSLPEVAECAVVALDSEQWGQRVAAVVVLSEQGLTGGRGGKPWGPMDMRRALRDVLANYKIPTEMKTVESIPRNAMGKINKKALVQALFAGRPKTPPPALKN
ncbi:AMP-dependent synthetase/ligase [Macrophomina phaseolina MS6]|uniref:AMP-dependent synthetase/ligase n=1 Tax=Macrophomina phaseolina (strain MS6) TaxID=1126212 RepID=K2S3M0_MACPH|nr:AMP-dependent synthetase/ligase [Macrophomina phaseolina MS6]